MNISEAARLAYATGTRMTRRAWNREHQIYITPTYSEMCCIIQIEGVNPGPRWNPDAADLLAQDWIVEGNVKRFAPKTNRGDAVAKCLFKLLLLLIGKKRYGRFSTTVRFDGKAYELTIDEFLLQLWEPEELRETESSR